MSSTIPKHFEKRSVSVWTPTASDSDSSSISIPCCHPRPYPSGTRTLIPVIQSSRLRQYLEDKRLGSLDIFFKDAEIVELGDVAHGWVEMSLERPAFLTSMSISFYGEVTFELFNQLQTRQFETRKYELWKNSNHSHISLMEPGFYVYEFFVGTHTALPVPFEGDGAVRSLTYYCEVTVVESLADDDSSAAPIDHIKRKILTLRPSASISRDDGLFYEPVSEKGLMYVRNILDCSGTIVLTATLLDGRQYRPGDNIRFRVEVLNCFRRLKIEVALVQKAKACVDDSFVAVELDVVRIKLGKLASSETYKRFTNVAVWIPSPNLAPVHVGLIYANRLVQIGYAFRVTVMTWTGKKLVVEIPLIVRFWQNFTTNDKIYATL